MLKYTNLENACHNLRQMAASIICPGDEFFCPLADAIEALQGIVKNAVTQAEMDTLLVGVVERLSAEDREFWPVFFAQEYRDIIAGVVDLNNAQLNTFTEFASVGGAKAFDAWLEARRLAKLNASENGS